MSNQQQAACSTRTDGQGDAVQARNDAGVQHAWENSTTAVCGGMSLTIRHDSTASEKKEAWAEIKQRSPDLQRLLTEMREFGPTRTVIVTWR